MANQCIKDSDVLGNSSTSQQDGEHNNEAGSSSNDGQATSMKYFFLKPALRKALSSVGAIYKPYTFKEVLSLLKAYIFKNKALDPQDSRFVLCADTDLGRAFGVEKFEYSQVRNLLSKNLFIAANIKIEMPIVPDQQEGSESEYSYQGYDTAVCEDSDDDTVVEEEVQDDEVEYELVTESEAELRDPNDSESDVENILLIVGLDESEHSEDECFADGSDSSSSESDENSSDDERDQWNCMTCGIKNKPFMRYCLKCWELRKDWYPEPPKRRRKRKARPKKDRRKMSPDKFQKMTLDIEDKDGKVIPTEKDPVEDTNFTDLERTSSTASSTISSISSSSSTMSMSSMSSVSSTSSAFTVSSQDSGFSSQDLASYEVISVKKRKVSESDNGAKKMKAEGGDDDDEGFDDNGFIDKINKKFKNFTNSAEGKSWLKSSKAEDFLEMLQNVNSEDSGIEESPLSGKCIVCFSRPKNASIIHGRLAHIGFCYPCAKRLYNSKLKCPVCRRKIHMITKNAYV